jgi:hypothetical protein
MYGYKENFSNCDYELYYFCYKLWLYDFFFFFGRVWLYEFILVKSKVSSIGLS